MSGILAMLAAGGGSGGSGGGHLDTQTVTTGTSGTSGALDRKRGFISGTIGSISDGTSNVYSGTAIDQLYWDENGGGTAFYKLAIGAVANSGWSTMTIGSTVLARASGTYSSGTWTWNTTDGVGVQAFGSAGSVKTVYFD